MIDTSENSIVEYIANQKVFFSTHQTKVINFSTEVLPEALIPVNEITLFL